MPKAPKSVRPLSPLKDLPFKVVFCDQKDTLPISGLIEDVRGLPGEKIRNLVIADPGVHPKSKDGKRPVLDLRGRTATQEVNVEIQRLISPELLDRILYYLVLMIAAQVKSGGKYKLPKSITIVFANFLFKEFRGTAEYHHRFVLFDKKTGREYPNSPEIHILELPKIPDVDDGTRAWPWVKFFRSKTLADFEALKKRSAAMKAAVARLVAFSADEKARIRTESYEKGIADQAARIRDSRAKGRAKGRAEGEANKQAEIARRMLRSKVSPADVAKFTGLSEAAVSRLAASKK